MSIADKDLVNVVLTEQKMEASVLSTLIQESVNMGLRNDATNLLGKTFQQQKRVFDLMASKGWYKTEAASTQDLTKAKQEISGS